MFLLQSTWNDAASPSLTLGLGGVVVTVAIARRLHLHPLLEHHLGRHISPLVYWVLQTSTALVWSLPSSYPDAPDVPLGDPHITLSHLVALSKFIGKHVEPGDVPTAILGLFLLVTGAVYDCQAALQRIATKKTHPDVEKGISSLERFAEALGECYVALGGWDWALHDYTPLDSLSPYLPLTKGNVDCLVIKEFVALDPPEASEADQDSEQETSQQAGPRLGHQRKQARPGKGKRGRRRKDKDTAKSKAKDIDKGPLPDVLSNRLLDSFDVTLDEHGMTTGYIIAAYDLIKDCVEFRAYLQDLWYEVAYEGLHSAVAGALSNTALNMIHGHEDVLSANFPDKQTFHSVISTVSSVLGLRDEPGVTGANKGDADLMDAKEMLLLHTYHDLLDFITDYQKNDNGKPTKRMMKELNNWNPDFDLRRATMEERLKWRRAYTINWLYDLANVLSNRMAQVAEVSEKRPGGGISRKEAQSARVLGLTSFAFLISLLATSDGKVGIRERILPHHVFQLQCIVDSLTVTKGWIHDLPKGHVFIAPPPADKFRPMRDVDLFLHGIDDARPGILTGFERLEALLRIEANLRPTSKKNPQFQEILEAVREICTQFLGKHPALGNRSRFSTTDPNALWHYSPYLCGVGLAEALDAQFVSILYVWGHQMEPVMLMHLYNFLRQEGYLEKPVDLFESLQRLFPTSFFPNGEMPVSDHGNALADFLIDLENKESRKKGKWKTLSGSGDPVHLTIPYESMLVLLREKAWNIYRVPDDYVALSSLLAKLRIAQTEHITDHVTGKRRLKKTTLVKRAKAALVTEGLTEDLAEEKLLALADALEEFDCMQEQQAEDAHDTPQEIRNCEWLDILKVDLTADVDGDHPTCGLNLAKITWRMINIFGCIEEELRRLGNKTYLNFCNDKGEYDSSKYMYKETDARTLLVPMAMVNKDVQFLEVVAKTLAEEFTTLSDSIYWRELKLGTGRSTSPQTGREVTADASASTVDRNAVHMDECVVIKGVATEDGTVLI
ncbi:uncharacterized protein B0T23DRAFT_359589 [Neurospora hispaniola]|uniref:DUF6604 domain-containing protein n=1 Tax=Neurospora hispaniola TaxID=588809 RepID=A0AAJ0I4V2_9PEZI|nr:hypothetical protein B0T23DRAFT_359589 [Neurospora hispaniola]